MADDLNGSGPLGCRPWPHLPCGTPPCRVGQVGEGVSPLLMIGKEYQTPGENDRGMTTPTIEVNIAK